MPLPRHVAYLRASMVFLALTAIGAIATGVFYGTGHTKRGLAAVIGTAVMAVIAIACYVTGQRYRRGRMY